MNVLSIRDEHNAIPALVSPLVTSPRPWPGLLAPFWWAARAVRNELWGFRFSYPIEPVPAAGGKASLHYYVYSDRLFFDVMELDADGVPVQRSRALGRVYNPSYVAWYGLMRLERALRGTDPAGRAAFLTQVDWLAAHAVRRPDGAVVWQYDYNWIEEGTLLKVPWISAMTQGLGMSALIRGRRLTGDSRLLDLAVAASRVFEQSGEAGGVRRVEDGRILYEEYPGAPPPGVLDGFLFSLLGLYDLSTESADPALFRLFTDGLAGLRDTLPLWNYRDRWSWYGARAFLSPPHYNTLNAALLASLARLSSDATLTRYAQSWNPRRLTFLGRVEVFLAFLLTKNWSRIRHRTWRFRADLRGSSARTPGARAS